MTALELKQLLREHSDLIYKLSSKLNSREPTNEDDYKRLLRSREVLEKAIDEVFTERDYARYMCDAIRREFGAGLNDPKPFTLPWEKP